MRNFIIYSSLLFAFIAKANAQSLKANNKIKASVSTFVAVSNNINTSAMVVSNVNNKLSSKDVNISDNTDIKISNPSALQASFDLAFNKEKLQKLLPERSISIIYYVSSAGVIKEVSFILPKVTAVTAFELEKLEEALKVNVHFSLMGVKRGNLTMISQRISYANVINKTINPVN